jgi:hypothetical protein
MYDAVLFDIIDTGPYSESARLCRSPVEFPRRSDGTADVSENERKIITYGYNPCLPMEQVLTVLFQSCLTWVFPCMFSERSVPSCSSVSYLDKI